MELGEDEGAFVAQRAQEGPGGVVEVFVGTAADEDEVALLEDFDGALAVFAETTLYGYSDLTYERYGFYLFPLLYLVG